MSTSSGRRLPTRKVDLETASRLDTAIGRWVRWTRRPQPAPFGPGGGAALASVMDVGPIRLGDLAAREGVTPATLSRIVATLEKEKLLKRRIDPEDRRSAFVEITEAGRAMVVELRKARGQALLERLPPLTAEQRAVLKTVVEAVERMDVEG
jgi:DNA-binding MarR family transcriptional regulator